MRICLHIWGDEPGKIVVFAQEHKSMQCQEKLGKPNWALGFALYLKVTFNAFFKPIESWIPLKNAPAHKAQSTESSNL